MIVGYIFMKAKVSTSPRRERGQQMNNVHYLPSSSAGVSPDTSLSISFPPTLMEHLSAKVDESLELLREKFRGNHEIRDGLATIKGDRILHQLILSQNITTNRSLSEIGNKISRSIRVLPEDLIVEHLLRFEDTSFPHILHLLQFYDHYLVKNKEIFRVISSHHQKVKEAEDWSNIASNTAALKDYSVMAQAMGDKAWVLEANWRMVRHIRDFFFGELAGKFARKYFTPLLCRAAADSNPIVHEYVNHVHSSILLESSASRYADASSPVTTGRVRVLDVGSCYNPLARSPDASYLDITAVDLHPANNNNVGEDSKFHVHTCDFLQVEIIADIPSCVISTLSSSNSSDDASDSEVVTVVQSIPRHFYHAVSMSLVLCYLPDAKSRAQMVRQAYAALSARHGLLLIVEKDSILRNVNHPIVKQDPRATWPVWKRAMWRLGFACVKYEYFRHITNTVSSSDATANAESVTDASGAAVVRMSHIMIFVTREHLPDPIAPTTEEYHPDAFSSSMISPPDTDVMYADASRTAEDIEQLWIKQDLEEPVLLT